MISTRSDEGLPHIDVALRRSRVHDILAAVSKVGLVVLAFACGLAGFAIADHYRVSEGVGFVVGVLPPLVVAALVVSWYQFVAVPRFKRTLGEHAGQSLEQLLNTPSLNALANAAAADDCLFAKCMVDLGHTGLAVRVARSPQRLGEPLRPLPAAFSQVCLDETDSGFTALAQAAGYTLDPEREARTRKIILALALLFLIIWIAFFSWGEDFATVVLGSLGALALAGFAALRHRVRFRGQSPKTWLMPGIFVVRTPRGEHAQEFARHDSLLIWWVDRRRLTLASAAGQARLRVTPIEGELACRAWLSGRAAGVTAMPAGDVLHAPQPQPEVPTHAQDTHDAAT